MLHQPLSFPSGLVVPNRVALAPLTNMQSLPDGTLGDDELAFLARRADGGFGLIATCAAFVANDGRAWDGQLGIDRDALLPGLARLAERLRRDGGAAIVQLFHGGVRAASRLTGEQVWSASTWREDGKSFEVPRAATLADLERVIGQFADAAARAQAAGFDGVELHGAHGYLLSQFLSATQNPRTDGWGGDPAGRARLLRTTLRAVRARVGPRFTVGVRLSLEDFGNARGLDLDESLAVARDLAADGADFLHASLWDAAALTKKRPDAHAVTLLRAALPPHVRILAAGNVWTAADAGALLERGADVVALGRSAILNPDWPRRASDPRWEPLRPPVTRTQLADRALSPVFAHYMTRWKGFVAD
ncbi:MAG: NADH:flavin oxidoreductase [Deltaproteobacteria bacterium]|nr:NADH:flavin oxidoreductase [Deltaproteobacteria bacterium]MCW5808230.1 NADH:flavin oxidoreductase [Deltaproteobacteria bacterium]